MPELDETEGERKALDTYVDKLADLRECSNQLKFWKARADRIKAELSSVLGEFTVGTVSGEPVVFYEPKEQFRGGDFKKAYPDMYRLYTHDVMKKELDVDLLKKVRPDLYREFQTRAFRSTWDE